jgi:N-acetylmuramoyl-L-alanine amidase
MAVYIPPWHHAGMSAALLWLTTFLALPVVALDAGHGGLQEGAPGICGVAEKDVTLALARRTAAYIDATGQTRAYLVRQGDETLRLQQRADRAQRNGASVFVSIHANASPDPRVAGIETFFLSYGRASQRLLQLAHRENDGVDAPTATHIDPLSHILQGMSLDAAHNESQRLALRLQQTLQLRLKTRGRGVLQAPFMVLGAARMAAVLVEVGFITHPAECRRLASNAYQDRVARALAAGIVAHIKQQPGTVRVAVREPESGP